VFITCYFDTACSRILNTYYAVTPLSGTICGRLCWHKDRIRSPMQDWGYVFWWEEIIFLKERKFEIMWKTFYIYFGLSSSYLFVFLQQTLQYKKLDLVTNSCPHSLSGTHLSWHCKSDLYDTSIRLRNISNFDQHSRNSSSLKTIVV
jgi:hypothetical protein